ncbi:hypothetical protein, partial [Aestuariivirga sp.]|uniref:hypothetical protein n=1 Tax=Aestuariivirga sp. TaxID=2650926 RepID=UPI0037845626
FQSLSFSSAVLQSFVLQSLMSDVIQICDGNTMPGKLLQKSIARQEWRPCSRLTGSADVEKFGGISGDSKGRI